MHIFMYPNVYPPLVKVALCRSKIPRPRYTEDELMRNVARDTHQNSGKIIVPKLLPA